MSETPHELVSGGPVLPYDAMVSQYVRLSRQLAGFGADTGEYRKCRKPDCLRKVGAAVTYCCHACATAAEAPAPYEIEPYRPGEHWIHVHTEACEQRSAGRGEYTAAEVAMMAE